MQRSMLAREGRIEEGKSDVITEIIRAFAQNSKTEIEAFTLTSERLENGISIEFEMRANFNNDNRSRK